MSVNKTNDTDTTMPIAPQDTQQTVVFQDSNESTQESSYLMAF